MKKLGLIIVALVCLLGCTENERSRKFGGTMTVELPKGEKLLEATWKDESLFYLTEPMDPDYTPKTKMFREDSKWGIVQSTVKFVESR